MMSADAETASRRPSVVTSTATARSLPPSSDRNIPELGNRHARVAGLGLGFVVLRALGFRLQPTDLVPRANEPELVHAGGPLSQKPCGSGRAGVLVMTLDQLAQALGGRGVEFLGDDQLPVEPDVKHPRRVVHERFAAGHARAEVPSERAENDNGPVRHVFTSVAADALDDGGRARVADGEALARRAGQEELAAGRAVEDRVAGKARVAAVVRGRTDHDAASAQALADVVVRLAVENELDARVQESPEALACCALEPNLERLV